MWDGTVDRFLTRHSIATSPKKPRWSTNFTPGRHVPQMLAWDIYMKRSASMVLFSFIEPVRRIVAVPRIRICPKAKSP